VRRVLIPEENWQEAFGEYTDLEVIPVSGFDQALAAALLPAAAPRPAPGAWVQPAPEALAPVAGALPGAQG